MSGEATQNILSREELDALLETLREGGDDPRWKVEGSRDATIRQRKLRVVLEDAHERFAADHSRELSNIHQKGIRFSLIGSREVRCDELGELLLPTDRIAVLQFQPGGAEGYLVLSRSLFFHTFCLELGSARGQGDYPTPQRSYTPIETRFYRRMVSQILIPLERAWKESSPIEARMVGAVPRDSLFELGEERRWLATFDVAGFGETCRMRLAIPEAPFLGVMTGESEAEGTDARIQDTISDLPVSLRVEVGQAEISLSQFGSLSEGDVIPLDVRGDSSLSVRIGDSEKFRAVAGSVGGRLAVQVTERVA